MSRSLFLLPNPGGVSDITALTFLYFFISFFFCFARFLASNLLLGGGSDGTFFVWAIKRLSSSPCAHWLCCFSFLLFFLISFWFSVSLLLSRDEWALDRRPWRRPLKTLDRCRPLLQARHDARPRTGSLPPVPTHPCHPFPFPPCRDLIQAEHPLRTRGEEMALRRPPITSSSPEQSTPPGKP